MPWRADANGKRFFGGIIHRGADSSLHFFKDNWYLRVTLLKGTDSSLHCVSLRNESSLGGTVEGSNGDSKQAFSVK